MRLTLATLGFTMTIAQVMLMRELVAVFYGNELLFGLALMAWLAWGAVGSVVGGRRASRALGSRISLGLFAAGALLPVELALVRSVRGLLGVTPGALVEFAPMVGAIVLILAPLCLTGGWLFSIGARLWVEQGGTAGQAYLWESVGAVAGGALFSFVLIHWLDPFQTALGVTVLNLFAAANASLQGFPGVLRHAQDARRADADRRVEAWRATRLWPAGLLLLLPLVLPLGGALNSATLRWQRGDLAFSADSPYGRLSIESHAGQLVFFENGLLAFETQGTLPEEVVHFPLLAHPSPQNVLLIGGGVAGDLREILKHPVTNVTYVELDPLLISAAKTVLPPAEAAVFDDPRVDVVLTDGRRYVQQSAGMAENAPHHAFDVIILDLPEPATGALNRFYTREFFFEVQAVLNRDGIFELMLPSAENYWSPELARRNASVYQSLRAVFSDIAVLPGEHNLFLASDAPLETSPAVLAQRLADRHVQTRWVTPDYIKYVFTTDRFGEIRRQLEATAGVRLNEDLRPICYYYDLALWLSRFYPGLRGVFESAGWINLWWVAVPLALLVPLGRWRRGWAMPIAVAGIGLAQMLLEIVIIFAFQLQHGSLYAEVSLLVTAFMGGLAAGGAGGLWILRTPPKVSGQVAARLWLYGVQAAIALFGGILAVMLSRLTVLPQPAFPLLTLLAGSLTGIAFPLAAATAPADGGRTAGILYGADLMGGCLGALVGTGLLVPLLGLPQTCATIMLVALAGLLVM